MNESPIRVLVAEGELSVREAIADLLSGEPGLEVVAVADTAAAAVERAADVTPDVMLLNVRLPDGGGPQATMATHRVSPATRVIAFSAYEDRSSVLDMLRAGAIGYLVKGDRPEEIALAIRRAARGQGSLSADLVAELVAELSRESAVHDAAHGAQIADEHAAQEEKERGIADRRDALARLVSAGEEERRRIAGDIHDDPIQVMTAAGMRIQILRRSLTDPVALSKLDELEDSIRLAISRLRHLIFELRPPALDSEGLAAALRIYLDVADDTTGIAYTLADTLTAEPSEANRVVLYRIAQEVLTNVRKHSGARAVSVTLTSRDGGTLITIVDDGVGFAPDLDSMRPGHLGLAAIRERAELAGGWLRVESEPSKGTTVEFWVGEEAS